MAVVVVLGALRGRLGRGPLTAVLYFAGTLVPALGFFDVYPMRYSFVADHFQYLASIGILTLFVAGVSAAMSARHRRRSRTLAVILSALAISTGGALTWSRGGAFRDLESLWRDTLRKNPAAWLAHNNLGTVLQERGRFDEALACYRRAIELKSDYALALDNVGNVLHLTDRSSEAVAYYRQALHHRPDLVETRNRLGAMLQAEGRWDEAIREYSEAIRIRPEYPPSYYNLGNALRSRGRPDLAVDSYRRTLELAPHFPEAHNNLGLALVMTGRMADALVHFREALRQRPDWVQPAVSAARILATHPDGGVRREEEALRLARRAADGIGRDDPWVLDTLAAALAAAGRFAPAVTTAERARDAALALGDAGLAAEIGDRLRLYRQERPYRESPGRPSGP